MDLSIIVLSFNTKDLIVNCLKSVFLQYEKELRDAKFEIIIVDNNSSDGSADAIINLKIPNLKLIRSKENLGFAKGVNFGAKNAQGKYILCLNSDTQVSDKGFVNMVRYLDEHNNIAILGGKLKNRDGSLQPSAGKFYNLLNLIIMLLGLERLGLLRSSPSRIEKVDWVSGASMMIKKSIFDKLSGFDERYFMYLEDVDLCFRVNKLEYETKFYPDVDLIHKSWGSSNRSFAIINIYKGILRFYSKYKSPLEYLVAKYLLILKAWILIFIGLVTFNSSLRQRYKEAIS